MVPVAGLPEEKERLYRGAVRRGGPAPGSGGKSPSVGGARPAKEKEADRVAHDGARAGRHEGVPPVALEEHARTNDELAAANEELVSSNEELQSLNEELETAKEELQSTNEELTTVNDELHSRNQELNQVNSDLVNVLNTVDIPVLILDVERRIRRFTPKARSIMNVLPSDVGRPIEDIKLNISVPDLDAAESLR